MNRKHSRGAVISRLLTLALTMIQGIEAGMMPGGMGGMGGMPGGMGAHMVSSIVILFNLCAQIKFPLIGDNCQIIDC